MNVGNTFNFSELAGKVNVPPEMKPLVDLLLAQLDSAHYELISQLRAVPTLFTTSPARDPAIVEGAKPGDIAIYKDADGVVQVEFFG